MLTVKLFPVTGLTTVTPPLLMVGEAIVIVFEFKRVLVVTECGGLIVMLDGLLKVVPPAAATVKLLPNCETTIPLPAEIFVGGVVIVKLFPDGFTFVIPPPIILGGANPGKFTVLPLTERVVPE